MIILHLVEIRRASVQQLQSFQRSTVVLQTLITTRVSLTAFGGGALLGTAAISTQFCFTTIRYGSTLLCQAGYTLGSAMQF